MAGRPRTMAKRVGEIETLMEELLAHFERVMPEQYRTNPSLDDPVSCAWKAAWSALQDADCLLTELLELLKLKAAKTGTGDDSTPVRTAIAVSDGGEASPENYNALARACEPATLSQGSGGITATDAPGGKG